MITAFSHSSSTARFIPLLWQPFWKYISLNKLNSFSKWSWSATVKDLCTRVCIMARFWEGWWGLFLCKYRFVCVGLRYISLPNQPSPSPFSDTSTSKNRRWPSHYFHGELDVFNVSHKTHIVSPPHAAKLEKYHPHNSNKRGLPTKLLFQRLPYKNWLTLWTREKPPNGPSNPKYVEFSANLKILTGGVGENRSYSNSSVGSKGTFVNNETTSKLTSQSPSDIHNVCSSCTNGAKFNTWSSVFPKKGFNSSAQYWAVPCVADPIVLTIGRNGQPVLWILGSLYNLDEHEKLGFKALLFSCHSIAIRSLLSTHSILPVGSLLSIRYALSFNNACICCW